MHQHQKVWLNSSSLCYKDNPHNHDTFTDEQRLTEGYLGLFSKCTDFSDAWYKEALQSS